MYKGVKIELNRIEVFFCEIKITPYCVIVYIYLFSHLADAFKSKTYKWAHYRSIYEI